MITLDIAVEAEAWNVLPGLDDLLRRAADAALVADDTPGDEPVSATVLLSDDERVRVLNRAWRGQDKATNVLSFPSGAPEIEGEPYELGDIVLAYETLVREANHAGKTLDGHVAHLVVHGILHLLGHDHEDTGDADDMEARETRALLALGFEDPYRDTVPIEPGDHALPDQGRPAPAETR